MLRTGVLRGEGHQPYATSGFGQSHNSSVLWRVGGEMVIGVKGREWEGDWMGERGGGRE